jgi:hypothetical protein
MTSSSISGWDALEKRLDSVQKPIRTFNLCEDSDVRERYLNAKRDAEQADTYLKSLPKDADADARALVEREAKEATVELAAAQKAYDAKTITLRFTALERKALEKLQNAHPASEEDEARGNDFAFDTFAPELISAASLDGMPSEAARRYLETWATSDVAALWSAAWSIQHEQRADLGKG